MDLIPKGIAIPIYFSTNKLTRRTVKTDPDTSFKFASGRRPQTGYIELYFALRPVKTAEIDLIEPGRTWKKSEQLYRKHNVYGDHHFLVPVAHKKIEAYEARHGIEFGIDQIGSDPTTAVYREALQLLPCSRANLELFLNQLQSEPFYIEITEESFVLHVRLQGKTVASIPSQLYCPRCWQGFAHPVVFLETKDGHKALFNFSDIPWKDIAQHLAKSGDAKLQ